MGKANKRKKIMLISPMLHQGGFERICVMTARLLQKEYDVVIAVFSLEDVAYDISGLQVIDLKLKARKGKLNKGINVFRRSYRLTRLQRELDIDVSYSFGMTANIANALTTGARRKLTACHSFEEIKDAVYMKLISRHSDRVFCCSKKMADLVQKDYGFTNVQALWNPCDIEGIQKQSRVAEGEDLSFWETEDKVLVSMGREDDVKGFWHLLKAFRRINEKMPDTRLAIIGDGEFREYKELAQRLGIAGRVLFAGLKRNPFPYLRKSDLYLLTSLSEGLPNALVEALALSLPIVSVNCLSGPAEILHENWREAEAKKVVFEADYGILTPAVKPVKNMQTDMEEEEDELALAAEKLLGDPELYESYQKAAASRAADFSKEAHYRELVSYIEEIIN
ncbi:MAG: glycosyltransferase [Lachnospiraceae bacterium]|nr:glycosyltransferase [Lachnospiraceae bacterium]